MAATIPRSSILGFIIGVLPGAGATIASFLAYGMERNFVKREEKEKFGKGSVQGLSAPETANNAACSGSFVPLLTLGIPGSGTTAVMLGALLGFGIQPGPRLYQTNPEMVKEIWSLADQLGLSAFEYRIGYEIYDDHVPLWENAQIPAIDIIDFDYPNLFYNHWHTQNDVPENCSPQSLQQVGTLLLNYIYD